MGIIDLFVPGVFGSVLIAYSIPLGYAATGWNWLVCIGVMPVVTAIFDICPMRRAG